MVLNLVGDEWSGLWVETEVVLSVPGIVRRIGWSRLVFLGGLCGVEVPTDRHEGESIHLHYLFEAGDRAVVG